MCGLELLQRELTVEPYFGSRNFLILCLS